VGPPHGFAPRAPAERRRRVRGAAASLSATGLGSRAVTLEFKAPPRTTLDHAELVLDAYEHAISAPGGVRGAVMLGDEMIDEASRKMALAVAAKGRAAGMTRTSVFEPPA
jgi:citrate lyase subunit beta / citryl-CoA lyase